MIINQLLRATLRRRSVNMNFAKGQKCNEVRSLINPQNRTFHASGNLTGKMFYEKENEFVYNIVNKGCLNDIASIQSNREITDESTFDSFLNQNWRASSATEITDAFQKVRQFCVHHKIPLSDVRFDKLVDGLMDHCENLSDKELLDLLECLSLYPSCESFTSNNLHDVWSCLDDICCWKMAQWDIEQLFSFGDVWYKLNLGRVCDFIFKLLDKISSKADSLTKDQLVRMFFYFNICRKRPVNFEYEFALQYKIKEMNVDEMAVVALGYFKTESRIKILSIMKTMILEVTRNSKSIHEITLTSILKILRYSNPGKLTNEIYIMLDKLYPELERFSDLTCLHLALLLTSTQTMHKNILDKCSQRFAKNASNNRLKDIERILTVLTMFNYDPKTEPDIFKITYEELQKDERIGEISRYRTCLPSALNYLSLKGIYSYELMDRILDADFIKLNFGKAAKNLPRNLLSLDTCIDIECPDYKGNRLEPNMRYKAVKWHIDFAPSHDQYKKLTMHDKLMLDVKDSLKRIVENENLIMVHHVLPHFPKADLIVCKKLKTGKFIEPTGFQKYILGDIMVPFNDGTLKWYAIVVLGQTHTTRDTNVPLGHSLMKLRHLEKIGYNPVTVIWSQFLALSSEERPRYLLSKLN